MKIRILNNSIRFRVSMDEMVSLAEGQSLLSEVKFISDLFSIKISPNELSNHIDYSQNCIHLKLNLQEVKALHSSSQTGFTFSVEALNVLFEKDFKCLTERKEDESNLYKNPRKQH